ncbi:hypothetical protein AURDEDRAFT_179076 [Auricularia subglabra TFB-10046 SS5]|nr:hypothetical protein AURDEDRAFT_179076 [Auricularia subglabra TFB-10046 SS5]
MRIRGEVCVGAGTLLTFAAVALLVFIHVGQINTSTVPRGVAMVSVDMSGYALGLEAATGDPTPGLYTTTPNATLAQQVGLRQTYKWGLYSYCAYVNARQGTCSNLTVASHFRPGEAIVLDTPQLYSIQTRILLAPLLDVDGSVISVAAYYLLLVGSIFTFLAAVVGVFYSSFTFLVAAIFATLGTLALITSAALWTVLARKANAISSVHVVRGPPLGVHADFETGLWLLWASAAAMFVSILPYLISCFTFRR